MDQGHQALHSYRNPQLFAGAAGVMAPVSPSEIFTGSRAAVAKPQRFREPFVGSVFCGQSGESPVEQKWMRWKLPANRLFLLSFFRPVPVHEKDLAKRRLPYYAWCSSSSSTQDVVGFDSKALSGWPPGDRATGGRGQPGKSKSADPLPASCCALHETPAPAAKCF